MTRLSGHDVVRTVSHFYGHTPEAFRSRAQYRRIARPRQVAMYAMRELCPHLSLPAIGRVLGNRDHTTILHGVRMVQTLIDQDPDFARGVHQVMALLTTPDPVSPFISGLPFPALCDGYARAMGKAA